MRIFQATYRDRTGATRRAAKWYVELRNAAGVLRRVPGFTDRRTTEAFGRQLVRLVNCKGSGQIPDPALMQWLEGLPGRLQSVLARQGFLDGRQSAGMKPLADHVTDFGAYLAAKGNTAEHVEKSCARVRRVVDGCGFTFWSEITASKVLADLDDLRADKADEKGHVKRGIGAASFNHYLTAFKGFCRWMVKDGRAGESPVAYLDGLNARTDVRHDRRALTVDEVRRLLTKTRGEPDRAGLTGEARATLYRVAVETGLRRGELASLTQASFNLEVPKPTVAVEAGYSKHRRRDVLPLRPDTAAELRGFLANKLPAASAFPLPNRDKTIRAFKADLKAAGIDYEDDSGRVADFHSLRHTAGTLLAATGVHPKVAQSLMRHSDINLTMSRYSHVLIGQESDAVAGLPDLGAPPAEAVKRTADGRPALPDAPGRPKTRDDDSMRQSDLAGDSGAAGAAVASAATGAIGGGREGPRESAETDPKCLARCLALAGGKGRTSANFGGRENSQGSRDENPCESTETCVESGPTTAGCRSGGTGRRAGFKIPLGLPPVRVRLPPSAPLKSR